jgi:hypothetical protein
MVALVQGAFVIGQGSAGARPKYDAWVTTTTSSKLRPVTLLDVRSEGLLLGPATQRVDLLMPIGDEGLLLPAAELGSLWVRGRNARTKGAVIGGVVGLMLGTGTAYLLGRDRTSNFGTVKVTYTDQNTLLYGLLGSAFGFSVGLGAGSQRHSLSVNGNVAQYEALRPQLMQYMATPVP